MNIPTKSPSPRQPPEKASMESLLHALDAETDALPPAIVDRLASARRQALMRMQNHQNSGNAGPTNVVGNKRAVLIKQNETESATSRLQQFIDACWQNRPVSASLAACCVASLAAILFVNSAQMTSTPTQSIIKTTPQPEQIAIQVPVNSNLSFVKAESFDTDSTELLPIMSSEESLDLVGSVDFLLWLDSQQG